MANGEAGVEKVYFNIGVFCKLFFFRGEKTSPNTSFFSPATARRHSNVTAWFSGARQFVEGTT